MGIEGEEEATDHNAGSALSFFWTAGVGNPDAEAHQRSPKSLSPGTGGTLLSLSLPTIVVRLQQHGWLKGGGRQESGGRRKRPMMTLLVLPLFLDGRGREA
jgi:hypothetical protein